MGEGVEISNMNSSGGRLVGILIAGILQGRGEYSKWTLCHN